MYNEYRNHKREAWLYQYLGKDLLPYARKKLNAVRDEEHRCRERASCMLRDVTVSGSDAELNKLRERVNQLATEAEQCVVFEHEFARQPDREYNLALADVVYFGLTEPLTCS